VAVHSQVKLLSGLEGRFKRGPRIRNPWVRPWKFTCNDVDFAVTSIPVEMIWRFRWATSNLNGAQSAERLKVPRFSEHEMIKQEIVVTYRSKEGHEG
jgi:hypothetical protein